MGGMWHRKGGTLSCNGKIAPGGEIGGGCRLAGIGWCKLADIQSGDSLLDLKGEQMFWWCGGGCSSCLT